jgi:hypothetical protein
VKDIIPSYAVEPLRVGAKAGFLSQRIWDEFFGKGNRFWRYRRWKGLMDLGLFCPVPNYGFTDTAVSLTPLGRDVAHRLGFDPVYPPQAKNLWHDEELVRLALFLERKGWIASWMTEQAIKSGEMRKSQFTQSSRASKFPDLFIEWKTPKGMIPWAVELERTRKVFSRYYDMVGAYKGISSIDSVLVIVASPSIEANIKKAQAKMNYPDRQRPMVFASLDDIAKNPGACELRHGSNSILLSKFALTLTGRGAMSEESQGKNAGHIVGNNVSSKKLEKTDRKQGITAENNGETRQPPPPTCFP